jgi:hypothetical protein
MTQRSAGAADAAGPGDWRFSRRGLANLAEDSESATPHSCPLAIIARGIVVLSVVVGGFGFALAKFAPSARLSSIEVASPVFAIPKPRLDFAWRDAALSPTPVALTTAGASVIATPQNAQVRSTFLNMLQSALASRQDVLQFGSVRVKRSIVETIVKAAEETNTDPVLLMAIADKESSFSPNVEARSSSAMGLFQFVDNTWLKAVREFGAKYGLAQEASMIGGSPDRPTVADSSERAHILGLRRNPYLSAVLAAEMLKRDGQKISERIGRGLTGGETYLAHFLGPDDAEKFMEKVVGQPQYMAAALLPRPAHANASIFYSRAGRRSRELSVAAVHDKFEEMMGMRLARYKSLGAAEGLSAFEDEQGK